ncbi:YkvA family protein [Radiobacillus sp. PE A8.2]|uniref:YkvA family protein n=1 Tax=Radiobacillus sp. PE A8.2 TaxID=3380349 RepID=UPI00388EF190
MIRLWKRLKFIFKLKKSIPFFAEFFVSKKVKFVHKLLAISLMFGYAIFPFDVIPDPIIALGIVDDVAVISIILQRIVRIAPPELKRKYDIK